MEFSDMVKLAREQLGISQETLSKEIGVSFATVNRWEANKTLPSFKAQKAFMDYCAQKNVTFAEGE